MGTVWAFPDRGGRVSVPNQGWSVQRQCHWCADPGHRSLSPWQPEVHHQGQRQRQLLYELCQTGTERDSWGRLVVRRVCWSKSKPQECDILAKRLQQATPLQVCMDDDQTHWAPPVIPYQSLPLSEGWTVEKPCLFDRNMDFFSSDWSELTNWVITLSNHDWRFKLGLCKGFMMTKYPGLEHVTEICQPHKWETVRNGGLYHKI